MPSYAENNSEYVTAHILNIDNSISTKPFKKSNLGDKYDKYKDENGEIYLLQAKSNNKQGYIYTIIDKANWEQKAIIPPDEKNISHTQISIEDMTDDEFLEYLSRVRNDEQPTEDIPLNNTTNDFDVLAHVLDVDKGFYIKLFRRSELSDEYETRKDENGEIYILTQENNDVHEYAMINKPDWYAFLNKYNQATSNSMNKMSSNINYKVLSIILALVIVCILGYNNHKKQEAIRIENERIEAAAISLDVKIDSIGKVTAEDANLISECRALYNNSEYEVQKSVTSLNVLTEAERLMDLINNNPLPVHGTTSEHYKNSKYNPLPPLSIDLSECSASQYYYIKILDYNTNEVKQTLFMHPKTTIEIGIPAGDYKILYACGSTWYGPEETFGEDGHYEKAEEKFSFTKNSKGAHGYTITLYTVEDGNLDSTEISFDEFRNS